MFAILFDASLAPSVAFGAQVLPAAASYHSTIRYFIRCLAPFVAFGAQVLPAASYHSTIRLCNIFGSTNASHTSHIG